MAKFRELYGDLRDKTLIHVLGNYSKKSHGSDIASLTDGLT